MSGMRVVVGMTRGVAPLPHFLIASIIVSLLIQPAGALALDAPAPQEEALSLPEDFPRLAFPFTKEQVVRAKNCNATNLNERMLYWQERFRLGDWRIGIGCGMVPKYKGYNSGLTMWHANEREAFIWIDPEVIEAHQATTIEAAIIHEMLHVAQAEELETRTEKDIEQYIRTQADLIYEYEWKIKALEAKLARQEKRK